MMNFSMNIMTELGRIIFISLLKPLADLSTLTPDEFVDWGHEETFETAIGVGECAGVMIDLVSTLLLEAEEKLQWSVESFDAKAYSDSIYHAYSVFISSAKAMLTR
jgi:sulfite reductase (ferredoxin)